MRNSKAVIDWPTLGPRALAWLTAEVPRRHTLRNVLVDCEATLGAGLRHGRLSDWLNQSAALRAEWNAIKRLLGTGPHGATASSAASSPVPGGLTILAYDRQERVAEDRARCPVCKLPPAIREEIADAKRAGLTQARILPALARVHNITIAPNDWTHHINGKHEQ